MELLLFNENHQASYYGKCKIVANSIKKSLNVIPNGEDQKNIAASFEQQSIQISNLLCFFASKSDDDHNFVLIFSKLESCKKIYEIIQKSDIPNKGYQDYKVLESMLQTRFLEPLFSQFKTNKVFSTSKSLKNIFTILLEYFPVEKREKYLTDVKIENATNFYSEICDETKNDFENIKPLKNAISSDHRMQLRKRPLLKKEEPPVIKSIKDKLSADLNNNKFDDTDGGGRDSQNLDSDFFDSGKSEDDNTFSNDSEEEEELNKSLPQAKRAKMETIVFNKIIEEPNFKLFNFERKRKIHSRLVIFPLANNDKTKFYEYFKAYGNKYSCCGCRTKNKYTYARVCQGQNQNFNLDDSQEQKLYVEIDTAEKHVCDLREKTLKEIIKPPNFKVFSYTQRGILKKNLFIFSSADQKYIYDYFWENGRKVFTCNGCQNKDGLNRVKLFTNLNDGEEFVKLSKNLHVCEPRKYEPEKYLDDIILLKSSDYKIVEHTYYGAIRKKLLIFVQENKDLCYEFLFEINKIINQFYCIKCGTKNKKIRAYILKNENGNEYVSIQNRFHLCQPIPYCQNNYEINKIIRKPYYQIMKRKWHGKFVERLAIFSDVENNKKLCYEYFNNVKNLWICCGCKKIPNAHVYVKFFQASNAEDGEYIEIGKNEHKCEPIEFLPDTQVKMVNQANFKLEKYQKYFGQPKERLVIFDLINKKLCYIYTHNAIKNGYQCGKCFYKKKIVTAKILINNDKENYLQLNETEHVCEMEEYKPWPLFPIIKKPNFYFEPNSKAEMANLIIIDSKNPNLCYTYVYRPWYKFYQCLVCQRKLKKVTAKFHEKVGENGEDYVELGPFEHVCEPQPKT